ncbi:TMV resistance protein N, partial [Trifolium medium]|nr:TMV resistance protein N [Trifolium medium]
MSCPTVMDTLGNNISQGLTNNVSSNVFLPDGNHASFLAYTGEGPSAPFQVPKDIDCHMEGIVLRVVYSSTSENMAADCLTGVLIINYTKCTIHIYKRDTVMSFNDEDWKNVASNLGPGDDVKIYVAFGHGLIVKKTTVYLISGQPIIMEVDDANMKMEPSEEVNVLPYPEVKGNQLERECIPTRVRLCEKGVDCPAHCVLCNSSDEEITDVEADIFTVTFKLLTGQQCTRHLTPLVRYSRHIMIDGRNQLQGSGNVTLKPPLTLGNKVGL